MRVISQNGRTSVDFDTSVFDIGENHIYAEIPPENRILMGSFKERARVQEVFDEIHETYRTEFKDITNCRAVYQIPRD